MRLLLDTHVLLWAIQDPERLDFDTRDLIENAANVVLFSAASIWEIANKAKLGRADFAISPQRLPHAARLAGFEERPVPAAIAYFVPNSRSPASPRPGRM